MKETEKPYAAEIAAISIFISLPKTNGADRRGLSIWVNHTHGTWGYNSPREASSTYLSVEDMAFISKAIEKVKAFNKDLIALS